MNDERPEPVRVTAPDGAERALRPGASLVFGRSRHADLVVRGGPGLSRLCGQVRAAEDGARISNLSRSHSLVAVVRGQVTTLPPVDGGGSGVLVVTHGEAMVGSPFMHGRDLMVRVSVSTSPTAPEDLPGIEEDTETGSELSLDPLTKEFVTALMLCQGWLLAPSRTEALPTSETVARMALAATHTWDQLTLFDRGRADVRIRVTRRVEDHLRHLKSKVGDVLPKGTRVTRESLAHHLVTLQALTPAHLDLLEDEDWLAAQAELWWDA
ncbi:hypothetical protein DFP74_0030 [Nocardiopsis sp. Huas11]|uniref:hypothetical protein n=1 Tax=Nocardiopsis sp. Huas11 TaxID=2183912 RepID=UPI000EB42B81|nr:hypothetical protein [Nocardiopsis sp. Huas11]RKS04473.1 hypothetical protein DFP74_0030 [Nocardiopsis sp. Huas11]